MKKGLLYLLLFSYAVIIFKPVMPTIADTMAHIFWYSHHMATVHYENGKYHVHLEYADAAKKGYPEKNNVLKEELSNSHLPTDITYDFTLELPLKERYAICYVPISFSFTDCPWIPPEIAQLPI